MRALALLLLFLPAAAFAAGESTPVEFSGIETMTFQNGISPTPDYDGIRFYGIDAESTLITFGDGSWSGDSLIYIGDYNADGLLKRACFSVDLSQLPDSCVIDEVTVHLLLHNQSLVGPADWPMIDWYRLFRPFGVPTWTNRKTSPDTAWASAGIVPASAPKWICYGAATAQNVGSGANEWNTLWTALPEYAGFDIAMGADSLYSGYTQSSVLQDAARVGDVGIPGRWSGVTSRRWTRHDISHLGKRWHNGAWATFGAGVAFEPLFEADDGGVVFHSAWPETLSNGDPNPLTPWVTVSYVYAVRR